jgi:hypothetical protein
VAKFQQEDKELSTMASGLSIYQSTFMHARTAVHPRLIGVHAKASCRHYVSGAVLIGTVRPIEYVNQVSRLTEHHHFNFYAMLDNSGFFPILKLMHGVSLSDIGFEDELGSCPPHCNPFAEHSRPICAADP